MKGIDVPFKMPAAAPEAIYNFAKKGSSSTDRPTASTCSCRLHNLPVTRC